MIQQKGGGRTLQPPLFIPPKPLGGHPVPLEGHPVPLVGDAVPLAGHHVPLGNLQAPPCFLDSSLHFEALFCIFIKLLMLIPGQIGSGVEILIML